MFVQLFKSLLPRQSKKGKQDQADADPLTDARRHIDEKRFDLAREIVDARLAEDAEDAQAWCLRGELRYWEKDDNGAIECFETALRLRPDLHHAHYGLSLAYYELGQIEKSRLHAQYANSRNPINAAYIAQVGLCELVLGNGALALGALRRAVRLDPKIPKVWNNLGIVHRHLGYLDKAKVYFLRAVELAPDLEIAHRNLAELYAEAGDTENAEIHRRTAEAIASRQQDSGSGRIREPDGQPIASPQPDAAATEIDDLMEEIDRLVALGQAPKAIDLAERRFADDPRATPIALKLVELLEERGDFDDAIDVIEVASAHDPENPRLLLAKGSIFQKLCQHSSAAELLKRAHEIDPDDVDILLALANAYKDLENYVEVERVVSRIHAINNTPITRFQLAIAQVNACSYDGALENFESAMREHPEMIDPQVSRNLGICLLYLGRIGDALEQVNAAVAAEPNNPVSRFARGPINLILENYGAGWDDYTYRFHADSVSLRLLPYPMWEGQTLEGKRILVIAEQGLGDQVMFASCLADLLRENPATVYLEAHRRLEKTLARSFPQCRVVGTDQGHKYDWTRALGEIDYYVNAGDLARRYRRSPMDFPQHGGYVVADPERVAFWQERLAELGNAPKIGISWRGGTQGTRRGIRSLELQQLAPLLRHPAIQFVSLQYGDVAEEARAAETALGVSLPHWPEGIADLDEFAALVSAVDLVISVCNTTVHFAGALGKPVWVMTPAVPEWRYGLDTPSMRWYPSSVMFRQPGHGAWDVVIQQIKGALNKQFP